MKSLLLRSASIALCKNLKLNTNQIISLYRILTINANNSNRPFCCFTASSLNKPMLKQTDLINDNNNNNNVKHDILNDNPDSLLKNFKNLENKNQKRDPSQKPTLEQLLILKEKLTYHVSAFSSALIN
jgi:hypothetical protein